MVERENGQYTIDILTAMAERTIKRLWVLIILLVLLLFGSNAAWIWYESQFIDEVVTQEVDTGEGDAFIAGIGDVIYGESTAGDQEKNP